MEMILLDWTRMGRFYCLAGAVPDGGGYRIVRPLQGKFRAAPMRNVGWSAYQVDGHCRWEVFELVGVQPAAPEPPHLEDLWVRILRPRWRLAPPEQRRAVLAATLAPPGEALFGAHLTATRGAAFLQPGTGCRSLATLALPAGQISFHASCRNGAAGPDVRVELHLPGLEGRLLPVKDYSLLRRAEQAGDDPEKQLPALAALVGQMGERVAVRLGLSRPFAPRADCGPGRCWLMADGFFSLSDPQP